jgi:hypothetical protein
MPAGTDGTWTLDFRLAQSGTAVSGTALRALANGAHATYVVSGRRTGSSAGLTLDPQPGGVGTRGPEFQATIVPLEGGTARLDHFQGRDYGQTLSWLSFAGSPARRVLALARDAARLAA